MKHIRISLIVALILGAVVALSSVRAADAAATTTEAPAKKKGMTAEQRLDRMAEQLGLNAEQKTKLKAATDTQTKAMADLRKDSSFAALTQEEKQAKMKPIRDDFNKQVKSFLTEEQKTKFDALQQQQGGKKGKKKA
jgi:Spy/CpxP family protein refolding chaperone